jgi:DNA-directed RNA polymerase
MIGKKVRWQPGVRYWKMICQPRPWHGAFDGGYLLGDDLRFSPTSMIRGAEPVRESVEEALKPCDARLAASSVFASLNILQKTPYAINEAVHDIARVAATANLKLDDLPASYVQERIPKAPPTGDTEALLPLSRYAIHSRAATCGVCSGADISSADMEQRRALTVSALRPSSGPHCEMRASFALYRC